MRRDDCPTVNGRPVNVRRLCDLSPRAATSTDDFLEWHRVVGHDAIVRKTHILSQAPFSGCSPNAHTFSAAVQNAGMKKVDENTPGGRLRALRVQHGMKQADLAAAVNRSRAHISHIENGDPAGREFWELVAAEFEVSIDSLLQGAATAENNDAHPKASSEPEDKRLEMRLLASWRALNPFNRGLAVDMVDGLLGSQRAAEVA